MTIMLGCLVSLTSHKVINVTPPIGGESRNVGESIQQNKTTSAQIYFSQTKIQSSNVYITTIYRKWDIVSGSPKLLFW